MLIKALIYSIFILMVTVLFGCAANPVSPPDPMANKQAAQDAFLAEASLRAEQESMFSKYGITLTREQIESINIDAFLHDMDCFFGSGGAPFAVPAENAKCERYEGDGYAYQRWLGGEIIIEEMLIGDVQVYQKELSFPIEEDIGFPE